MKESGFFAPVDVKYFDVLPIQPPPRNLESLTGYLMRVARANGIPHLAAFAEIIATNIAIVRGLDDCPLYPMEKLATPLACAPGRLFATTFFHVGKKFGRTYSVRQTALKSFLKGSLSRSLRFCPICLDENLHYSLKWRFLSLPGCHAHACKFLERCGHCRSAVPLISFPPRLEICPACGDDLRSCRTIELSNEEWQIVGRRSPDLEYLLKPAACEEDPATRERVAQSLEMRRQERQMSIQQISECTALPLYAVVRMGQSRTQKHPSLLAYLRYADALEVTLREILQYDLTQEGIAL